MKSILKSHNLTKYYGSLLALDRCNLEFKSGEIWGILGPNGSGKSTFLGTVLSALKPSNGSYEWFEGREQQPQLKIGSLLESPRFYPYLNALDNLKIIALIKNSDGSRISELLKWVGLYERRKTPFSNYSLGMKQRLGIAATLVGDPDVLVLDEPTNGLDPEGIVEIRSLLFELRNQGKTIIMASHILDEVEKVCTHVAILKKGKILKAGKTGSLLNPTKKIELKSDNSLLHDVLKIYPGIQKLQIDQDCYTFETAVDFQLKDLTAYIQQQGVTLYGISEKKVSLEDEFIEITRQSQS